MSAEKRVNIQLGGSTGGFLTIVLVILKATGFIDWSWLWVFAPMWIPLVILMFLLGMMFLLALLGAVLKGR